MSKILVTEGAETNDGQNQTPVGVPRFTFSARCWECKTTIREAASNENKQGHQKKKEIPVEWSHKRAYVVGKTLMIIYRSKLILSLSY